MLALCTLFTDADEKMMVDAINKPFKTNLAPWCFKWDWTQGRDGYPRGVRYRATYGANNKPDYNG